MRRGITRKQERERRDEKHTESVKDRQGQTAGPGLGRKKRHGEQYRFNLFVHLIFKDLVLFVTAFQLGSHFISLSLVFITWGPTKHWGILGRAKFW